VDSLTADSCERNDSAADVEAQRVARNAIMEIPSFPELLTRLTRVFGPGAERDMIHQLIYWFSKPKMQNRWWAYKTADEWRDERGLNRKQVNKARARLKPFGVLEEKYGNYKRLHYRIDWVRLAELLSLPLKGGQSYEWDDFEDDDFLDEPLEPLKGGQSSWSDTPKGESIVIDTPQMDDAPDSYAKNPSVEGGQTNARDYTGDYPQDNSLLQSGAEPAFAEPAPTQINEKEEPKEGNLSAQPDTDKRHSQVAEPPEPNIAKEVANKVWALIFGLSDETDVTRFADHYIAGKLDVDGEAFTVERVAEKVREHLGGDEPLEAYTPWVQRCLEDKRTEAMDIEAAS
jgi:hypothetical protein